MSDRIIATIVRGQLASSGMTIFEGYCINISSLLKDVVKFELTFEISPCKRTFFGENLLSINYQDLLMSPFPKLHFSNPLNFSGSTHKGNISLVGV